MLDEEYPVCWGSCMNMGQLPASSVMIQPHIKPIAMTHLSVFLLILSPLFWWLSTVNNPVIMEVPQLKIVFKCTCVAKYGELTEVPLVC
jgi:hypothetical protein